MTIVICPHCHDRYATPEHVTICPYRIECPFCHESAGWVCMTPSGDRYSWYQPHVARRRAAAEMGHGPSA